MKKRLLFLLWIAMTCLFAGCKEKNNPIDPESTNHESTLFPSNSVVPQYIVENPGYYGFLDMTSETFETHFMIANPRRHKKGINTYYHETKTSIYSDRYGRMFILCLL